MSQPVDLFPTIGSRSARAEIVEFLVEFIESTTEPFSRPSLHRAANQFGCLGTCNLVVNNLLAVGLIERISPAGARPVYFRKARAA